MAAYWIARSRVLDAERYWRYASAVPDIIRKFGGKVIVRGGAFQTMEGASHFNRHVVLEFPTFSAALECYRSPEYQSAREHRLAGAGEVEITFVEGGEFTSSSALDSLSAPGRDSKLD